ncbi:MAG: ABC transporter substrate-binding protein, partial [Thermomicrobiales bacterium]
MTSIELPGVFTRTVDRRRLLTLSAGALALSGLTTGGIRSSVFAQDAPVRGGSVKGAVVGPVTSLDPFASLLGSGDGMAYQALYNSLLDLSVTGELIPELASEWTISEDALIYSFTLVEGVTFHDGTALDAAAIKWNIERYKAEG